MSEEATVKTLLWLGTSLKVLRSLPTDARRGFGYALFRAQEGEKAPQAKPLKGFGGGSVLEIVEDHDGDTYRAIYTVRFAHAVYCLHVFKKKSPRGRGLPKHVADLIRQRLAAARTDYFARFGADVPTRPKTPKSRRKGGRP